MAVENAICQLLEDNTSITDVVSTRIYPMFIPEGDALPAIVYHQVSGGLTHTTYSPTTGQSHNGQQEALFQVTCWAATPTAARNIAIDVQDILDGYTGTKESVTIQGIFMRSRYDIPTLEPWSDSLNAFGKAMDFSVYFHEAIVLTDTEYGYGLYGAGLYNNV